MIVFARIIYLLGLLYLIYSIFYDVPYSFIILLLFALLIVGLKLIAYFKLKRRLKVEPILLLPKESGPKELLSTLAIIGGLFLLAYLFPSLNRQGDPWQENIVWLLVISYWVLQFSLFRKHDHDYYLTNAGIMTGIRLQENIRWEKIATYQIVETFGLIKLKRKRFGTYFLQTDKALLRRDRATIDNYLKAQLNLD